MLQHETYDPVQVATLTYDTLRFAGIYIKRTLINDAVYLLASFYFC